MNFPGHKYFGPGNDSNRGDPVDKDDGIAKQHDIEYDHAETSCDVREADRKAIALFWLDTYLNKNWHSSIGFLGLGVKYFFESFTGVVYPPYVEQQDCECEAHVKKDNSKQQKSNDKKNESKPSKFDSESELIIPDPDPSDW